MTEPAPRPRGRTLGGALLSWALQRGARHVHERYIQHPQGIQNLTQDTEQARRLATAAGERVAAAGQEVGRRGKHAWRIARVLPKVVRERYFSGK